MISVKWVETENGIWRDGNRRDGGVIEGEFGMSFCAWEDVQLQSGGKKKKKRRSWFREVHENGVDIFPNRSCGGPHRRM